MVTDKLDTLGGMHPGTDAGNNEQRLESRLSLDHQPTGRLTLCTAYERLDPRTVRDVSTKGISMEIDRPVAQHTAIEIEYEEGSIDIRVNGRVAWVKPNTAPGLDTVTGGYVVGIELFSPGLLLNFLPVHRID